MANNFIFPSLTRIAGLKETGFEVRFLDKRHWRTGDYVAVVVTDPGGSYFKIELTTGRMMEAVEGDYLVGALGIRHATLEATGSWKLVGADNRMHLLTGAGLVGKLTSKSAYLPSVIETRYAGHLMSGEKSFNMLDYSAAPAPLELDIPVVLLMGTSMSAGKTTAARIIIRQLKKMGLKVVGAKLCGAGRYKDILAMKDAGADHIFDFVDVGLPSTVCPADDFEPALRNLISLIAGAGDDVAVIEIGASPLEPYNGDIAIQAVYDQVRLTVLCATDPYAVLGVMSAFDLRPDIVSGIAVNTLAGRELVERLCHVRALNLIEVNALPELIRKLSALKF